LFPVICCFSLNTLQLITLLRQALQIGDFVEYQLMADVLKILESKMNIREEFGRKISGKF
jgi:hypothetical protein